MDVTEGMLAMLAERRKLQAFRELTMPAPGDVDLCSNDYLGIGTHRLLGTDAGQHGSTGSRLLTGNSAEAETLEAEIASFHKAPAALLFNSGYDANLGLLSAIAAEGDTILYDFLSHASIRDGIRLSSAQAFPFLHNDMADLQRRLQLAKGQVFVVTESVFSMDGDLAPLEEIVDLCNHYGAKCIVDEAHATGIIGEHGEGLVQALELESAVMARIHTFGKALGCHGAVVLGSSDLKDFLLNFSRPLIYSTALPATVLSLISRAYKLFPGMHDERERLRALIDHFRMLELPFERTESPSPIQGIIIPGNGAVSEVAAHIRAEGIDVRPIRYPTVPKGKERLRVNLHSFNTKQEINRLVELLKHAAGAAAGRVS